MELTAVGYNRQSYKHLSPACVCRHGILTVSTCQKLSKETGGNTNQILECRDMTLTCAWKMERDFAVCSGIRTRTRNCLCSAFRGRAKPFMMLEKRRASVTVRICQNILDMIMRVLIRLKLNLVKAFDIK